MGLIFSKIKYVLTEEGAGIFIKRFFNYFLFYLKVFFLKRTRVESDWKKLKGKYKNERVFILGNGPSLNKTPLHLLKDEHVLCSNRFNLMFERLNFIPEFYACFDDRVLSTISDDIKKTSEKAEYVFLPFVHPSSGKNFYNIFKEIKNAYWVILNKFGYSLGLPYIGLNKSVTNCSLQIAAYMGFKEIYLLGVDLDYGDHKSVRKENKRDWTSEKDDDPNHFDPRYFGKGTKYHHPRMEETFKKWAEAKDFFESRGVEIYNATLGGKLEIFERVNLKDAVGLSDREEMLLFLERFGISEYVSNDLPEYFSDAVVIESAKDFDEKCKRIITDTDTAIKLIPRVVFDYIPYGPVLNQYIFVRREKDK